MSRPPRKLFLHLSALSAAEYPIYVDALRDIVDDSCSSPTLSEDELEGSLIGVREVRAWMKGRFREHALDIDKVGTIPCV